MVSLRHSFNQFADQFSIPDNERRKLFTLYVNTYESVMGKQVKRGEEETSTPQAGQS